METATPTGLIASQPTTDPQRPPPASFVRRTRHMRRVLVQVLLLIPVAAALLTFVLVVRRGLREHGIPFDFSFLFQRAGFEISEGITVVARDGYLVFPHFVSSDLNAQALFTGLYNTVRVAVLAIVFSTVLGLMVGVGRLSMNWLIRQITFCFVELIRNTPLLIQLLFWYFAVVLKLPPLSEAAHLYRYVIASQQGIFLPVFTFSTPSRPSTYLLVAGLALLLLGWLPRRRPIIGRWVISAGVITLLFGLVVGGPRPSLELPAASRFSVAGGLGITPEMSALLLALSVNVAAFIAEIVRGAILSVPKGQSEAASALGLSRGQVLQHVVLPQAVRIITPALGNQYVSLSKSTSLAIAVGYPDLFNVYGTVANQTGRALEGILVVMVLYLLLSWIISGLINLQNRRLLRRGAAR